MPLKEHTIVSPAESAPQQEVVTFDDLGSSVEELHRLFDAWERSDAPIGYLESFSFNVLRFAVHEWVANLVQHADFGDRAPVIRLGLAPQEGCVHCTIEDNSRGFDFQDQIEKQRVSVEAPLPPERGRGLLMLIACAENLRYHQPLAPSDPHAEHWHRLTFSISANKQLWIDIPF